MSNTDTSVFRLDGGHGQDFAALLQAGNGFTWSDGGSLLKMVPPPLTCTGARIIALAGKEALNKGITDISALEAEIRKAVLTNRELLGLGVWDFAATFGFIHVDPEKGATWHVQGDGALAYRYGDFLIMRRWVWKFGKNSKPPYLFYKFLGPQGFKLWCGKDASEADNTDFGTEDTVWYHVPSGKVTMTTSRPVSLGEGWKGFSGNIAPAPLTLCRSIIGTTDGTNDQELEWWQPLVKLEAIPGGIGLQAKAEMLFPQRRRGDDFGGGRVFLAQS